MSPEIQFAQSLFDDLYRQTTEPPGVTRRSYGDGENIAHALVAQAARDLDLDITHDAAGNQYMTLAGRDRTAPRIIIGSHMDSVRHGGNYDGAAGVVMGIAALHRLRAQGWKPAQDIVVMAIRAEELVWFPTPYAGSRMAWGLLPVEQYDSVKRSDSGRSLAEHIDELGFDAGALKAGYTHLHAGAIRCYIEPHIEQGPLLFGKGVAVGIVSGIRGNLRYHHCRVTGAYSHAGAVPREYRQDAVLAAAEFAGVVETYWDEQERNNTDLVCTIGQFHTDAEHHGITKIPGELRFTMDIRSLDNTVLLKMDRYLSEQAQQIGRKRRVAIELGSYSNALPAVMDPALRGMLHAEAQTLGIPVLELASGAGHDCAVFANQGVASAMIFVRNDKGSHNPEETMTIGDFAEATRLLVSLLKRLS